MVSTYIMTYRRSSSLCFILWILALYRHIRKLYLVRSSWRVSGLYIGIWKGIRDWEHHQNGLVGLLKIWLHTYMGKWGQIMGRGNRKNFTFRSGKLSAPRADQNMLNEQYKASQNKAMCRGISVSSRYVKKIHAYVIIL